MKNAFIIALAVAFALLVTGCAEEASAQDEFRSVIEAMTDSLANLADEVDAADDAAGVVVVLETYTGDVPPLNSRFAALQEKYQDAGIENFQENEDFAAAVTALEDANMRVIQTIIGLDDRFGDDEDVQAAAWEYIQSLSRVAEQE